MIKEELMALARYLSSRPIGPDSYMLDELLVGLDVERSRLGRGKFAVVLYQNIFDYDGLTDHVFILDSFDAQSEAIAYVESKARDLLASQITKSDSMGVRWVVESEGDHSYLPKSLGTQTLQTLNDRTYKLQAGPYDTEYNCFRVIGPFSDFVICDELFKFVNSRFELWHYFVKLGAAQSSRIAEHFNHDADFE